MNTRARNRTFATHDATDCIDSAAARRGTILRPRAPAGAAVLGLAFATMTAACIAQDAGVEESTAPEEAEPVAAAEEAVSCGFPASCHAIKAAAPAGTVFSDGEYGLYVGGDPSRPWTAYCQGMAGNAPREYLSLHYTGGSFNFSQYTAGRFSPGTDARTSYTKLRVDPATLLVDISDQTFSSSSGLVHHGEINVTSMPVGVAMSCDGTPSGLANIDLRGTSFAVAPNEFIQSGTSVGASSYSSNDQVVDLTGGGLCGWTVSKPDVFNPFNNAGGFQLGLSYLAPAL